MKIKTILEFSKLKVQDKTSWVSLLRKIVIILYFNQLIEYIPGTSFEKGSYIKEQMSQQSHDREIFCKLPWIYLHDSI